MIVSSNSSIIDSPQFQESLKLTFRNIKQHFLYLGWNAVEKD